MTYIKETLLKLLNTPSPSGDTENIMNFIKGELEKFDVSYTQTAKGAVIATIKGDDDERQKTLSAHVDTLGAMVKEVKGNGRIKFTQIGGYPWHAVEGEYVTISTDEGKTYTGTVLITVASSHVHGGETDAAKRNAKTLEIRIDEEVKSKDDVKKLGIEVGDFIYLDPRAQWTESGYIKSRHLDDKACVANLLDTIRIIKEEGIELPHTTNFFISNYEEVGHGASASIPSKTVEFLAVDMAAPGAGQQSSETNVTICVKDSSGPYDLKLRRHLKSLAESQNIDYKLDIYPFYGSDASAALRAGWEFKHGLIGPGVDASHSYERTHEKGLKATTDLCVAYVKSDIVD